VMQSWTGKKLAEFGSPAGLPQMQLVWRAELYRALYDEATARGIRILHGRRLTGIDGTVARFADGSTAEGDVIVGADGLRATARRLTAPAAPTPRYAGLLGFGARTDSRGMATTGDKMHMVFGKRAFFGYQITPDDGGWFANLPHRSPMSAAD